jgi:DNA-binding response OmpR family regulator
MRSSLHSGHKYRKILVIDDNLFILNLIKNILRDPKTILSTSQSGEEGYELACIQQPDIILLDRRLRDTDGDTILKRIKTNPKTKEIPVAMVSSDDNDKHILQCLGYGANDYIIKPFNAKTLTSKVKRLIENSNNNPDGFFFV